MRHTLFCTCHPQIGSLPIAQVDGDWRHADGSPARTYHIHKEWTSRDCDGLYTGSQTFLPQQDQDILPFWEDAIKNNLSFYSVGTLKFNRRDMFKEGFSAEWDETTEEGFSHWEMKTCFDPECAYEKDSRRDHSAEAAGY